MGLTFYPIEDITVLQEFRKKLSPFMKAIQRTTETLNVFDDDEEKIRLSIFNEVMKTAQSYRNGDDILSAAWSQHIQRTSKSTLNKEHAKLIGTNLQ